MFEKFLVQPLYNLMIFIVNHVPFADLGVSVIILTIIVRFILFPLSKNAIKTQIKMKKIQEPLKELKEKYKKDQHAMAIEMMKLYKENDIKPFSGFFLLFLQLPVIFALYQVFLTGNFPSIRTDFLYSFVQAPEQASVMFLGLIDITQKSILLGILVGLTQYIQAKISFAFHASQKNTNSGMGNSFSDDLMKSMQIQMTYVFPVIFAFIAYGLGGIIAMYFLIGNIFSIFQQIYLNNKLISKEENSIKEVQVVK
jgi:YidC/Oxa1 family membrane protein insertase